ncbi:MAG: hypothetical protein AAFW73_23295 [Bacteroidota bacterium]
MKKSILLCCSFLVFLVTLDAQYVSTSPSEEVWGEHRARQVPFLQLQGGLVFDQYEDAEDFWGFNYVSLGLGKWQGDRLRGLELDFLRFDLTRPSTRTNDFLSSSEWSRKKWALDLTAYQLYPIFANRQWWIGGGPQVSLGYARTELEPISMDFNPLSPREIEDYRLGIGGRGNLFYRLSQRVRVQVGVKVILLDLGYQLEVVPSPILNQSISTESSVRADFLRSSFYFPVGLTFFL